ncbi:hypothetical protein K461DRAFT_297576 [Myriangium duriaei CBS 260.36]|uniref:Uncharacterized protein n=1 Tax=Myriangium duriaei CBS 260.36 TaxID=1168546 RepID=A0A9P4MIT9_9PEZI|nr:hypothetical protein K461DRAFT_297576 [Myriangium duriaei CBS 260.36]
MTRTPLLESLDVRTADDSVNRLVPYLSVYFHNLKHLSIHTTGGTSLNFPDIVPLLQLQGLKSLQLIRDGSGPQQKRDYGHMAPFFQALPELEMCTIACSDGTAQVTLRELGQACARLKTLEIPSLTIISQEVVEGRIKAPLLSQIETMQVMSFASLDSAVLTGQMMARYAPTLLTLRGPSFPPGSFSDQVSGAFVDQQLYGP